MSGNAYKAWAANVPKPSGTPTRDKACSREVKKQVLLGCHGDVQSSMKPNINHLYENRFLRSHSYDNACMLTAG
jgi:hypothetical protein